MSTITVIVIPAIRNLSPQHYGGSTGYVRVSAVFWISTMLDGTMLDPERA